MSDRSRSLTYLSSEAHAQCLAVQQQCLAAGAPIEVYATLGGLEAQARLFRVSRTRAEIERKQDQLRARGWPVLATVLDRVGPQGTRADLGLHVTHAGPGESWHHYGEAFDAVPVRERKYLWEKHFPQWQTYGRIVVEEGLFWAGNWSGWREFPHAQTSPRANPLDDPDIEDRLRPLLIEGGYLKE